LAHAFGHLLLFSYFARNGLATTAILRGEGAVIQHPAAKTTSNMPPLSYAGAMSAAVRAAVELLGHGLEPARCAACDAPLPARVVFCTTCADTVEPLTCRPPALAVAGGAPVAVAAYGTYGGALADALMRMKYQRRPDLARPLGHLLRHAVRRTGLPAMDWAAMGRPAMDRVVPVPLHPLRLAARGYNQAALLANAVASELGVRASHPLRRVAPTAPQARLARRARAANVHGVFRARARLDGDAILLVDDIATTGATLRACAEALRAAGAGRVDALVVAIKE
jgi:ComF family protein